MPKPSTSMTTASTWCCRASVFPSPRTSTRSPPSSCGCVGQGRIALANWAPHDFWSELPAVQARFAPPPPAPSPMRWGTEDGLRDLFGPSPSITIHRRTFRYRFATIDRYLSAWLPSYSPFVRMAERIGQDAFDGFRHDFAELVATWNDANDGSLVLPLTYIV